MDSPSKTDRNLSLAEQTPAADGSKRLAYRLTQKGNALRPVLEAMRDWGLTWEAGTRVAMQTKKT